MKLFVGVTDASAPETVAAAVAAKLTWTAKPAQRNGA